MISQEFLTLAKTTTDLASKRKKDETLLHALWSTEKHIFATDGGSLVTTENSGDLAPGPYTVAKAGKLLVCAPFTGVLKESDPRVAGFRSGCAVDNLLEGNYEPLCGINRSCVEATKFLAAATLNRKLALKDPQTGGLEVFTDRYNHLFSAAMRHCACLQHLNRIVRFAFREADGPGVAVLVMPMYITVAENDDLIRLRELFATPF